MKVKDLIKLMPNGTLVFIQSELYHPDTDPPFSEVCEETYKVGSCKRIPCAEKEVKMLGAIYTQEIHIQIETIYV